jgi:predicted benzoate:H+ symporter BenE
MATYGAVQDDLMQLFAAGFDLNFRKLDIALPQGTISSKMLFSFAEEDPATFAWTSLLLNTEAAIDLSVPASLVDMLVQSEPNAAMVIGAGYLVKRGEAYEMSAEMKKGLLTVNGAPIPIPFGAMR